MSITELKADLDHTRVTYSAYVEESNLKRKQLHAEIDKAERLYNLALAGLDMNKINMAESIVEIRGLATFPAGEDISAVEDAIKWFAGTSTSTYKNLQERYFGTKNYDAWYHQREDHEYCYGPRHGSTVFSVGLSSEYRKQELTIEQKDAAIYYLEMLKAGKLNQKKAA